MAGIIGNMTAQKRLRRDRKEILSDKCVYELSPFSTHGFQPETHNIYMAACVRKRMKTKKRLEDQELFTDGDSTEDVEVKDIELIFQ